ncbi:hypothetical protein [Bdellovibrio sp. KM01]|uniref:hypothetical protein n=1 Tax=Bdellovibrio sp. KM01 TaxID=2748865 RepID=UPI0015EAE37C|nr:hypothetical protein [Bdellovibrio sp. KM01]QLY25356.1 hypothetical protein HW988_18400 [Bdellovibrio sp. KM01]
MRNAITRVFTILFAISFAGGNVYAQQETVPASEVGFAKPKQIAGAKSASAPVTSLDSSVAADTNEATAGGLEAVRKQFEKNFSELVGLNGAFIEDNQIKNEKAAYNEYIGNWDTCVKGQSVAAYACLSNLSPKIQDAVAALNVLGTVAGASGVSDSCSAFGKGMGIAQAALTAYTAACGAAKGHCGWYCSSTKEAVANMQKAVKASTPVCRNPQDPNCSAQVARYKDLQATILNLIGKELQTGDIQSIAGKSQVCTSKYPQLIASAASGIYGVVNALKQGKSCEEATDSSAGTDVATTAETCKIEANANLPECICLKNPMLEGCGSIAAKSSMSSAGSGLSALSATPASSSKDGLTAADLATGNTPSTTGRSPSNDSGSGGVGAPVGGGGANLGGGGGGSGSGASGEDKSGHKALDTNILAGSSGGGGGGGWGGGDSSSDKSGLRGYLPGGAKDPKKMGGAQQNWVKEVTGQGGKSNWEKVRDRYQDNKSSLLNN